jgi:PGDYG protein
LRLTLSLRHTHQANQQNAASEDRIGRMSNISGGAYPVFHSTAHNGYSSAVSSLPGRILARKLPGEVQIRFTPVECTVQTHEGVVHARPGDAIVTGMTGEHWRVSRAHFANKYRAVPPTVDGQDGRYASLPNTIMAVPMTQAFEVVLADGVSRLKGRAGDWLVDYGDGSLGIVSQAIFTTTYEIIG